MTECNHINLIKQVGSLDDGPARSTRYRCKECGAFLVTKPYGVEVSIGDRAAKEGERRETLIKGIVQAALELACLRNNLCYEEEPPIVVEQCFELVEDTWDAMRGIGTCSEEPSKELVAIREALAATQPPQEPAPGAESPIREALREWLHLLDWCSDSEDWRNAVAEWKPKAAAALAAQPPQELVSLDHKELASFFWRHAPVLWNDRWTCRCGKWALSRELNSVEQADESRSQHVAEVFLEWRAALTRGAVGG